MLAGRACRLDETEEVTRLCPEAAALPLTFDGIKFDQIGGFSKRLRSFEQDQGLALPALAAAQANRNKKRNNKGRKID